MRTPTARQKSDCWDPQGGDTQFYLSEMPVPAGTIRILETRRQLLASQTHWDLSIEAGPYNQDGGRY